LQEDAREVVLNLGGQTAHRFNRLFKQFGHGRIIGCSSAL
jgi:hypothetical protein